MPCPAPIPKMPWVLLCNFEGNHLLMHEIRLQQQSPQGDIKNKMGIGVEAERERSLTKQRIPDSTVRLHHQRVLCRHESLEALYRPAMHLQLRKVVVLSGQCNFHDGPKARASVLHCGTKVTSQIKTLRWDANPHLFAPGLPPPI